MKNRIIKSLIVGLSLIAGFTSVNAQESATMQFMKGLPQSTLQNPALHNDSSAVVVGLPGLSGLYMDVSSPFATYDLIHKGTGVLSDELVLDIDNFPQTLRKVNTLEQNLSIPMFYLGIRSKKSFFTLGITEKQTSQLTFNKSLVQFIADGNAPYVGQNYDLGNLDMDAFHYREFALGYSNEVIKNKLTLGLKAKILYGKMAMQTQRNQMTVETAADGTSIILNSDMQISLSAPVQVKYDSEGYFDGMEDQDMEPADYMLQNGNTGMAFDLGAVYKLTPKLTLSGSIVDLGRISFKKDITTLDYTYSYNWEGIDFSNSVDKAQEDYVEPGDLFDKEIDRIEETFKPHRSNFGTKGFHTGIPVKVFLGGTYELSPKVNIGLLERFYKHGEFTQNTLSLSGNTLLGNFLTLSGSYSVIGHRMNNLGLGMAVRAGFFQFYVVGDNMLALRPSRANYANARFGVNFLMGRKRPVPYA